MKISIKHSTVHLLHLDSTETAENVGNVFAHDVPLIHARRCKGVGWLIKIEHSKEKAGKKNWELKRKKKEQTFVPLVSSQRNRGDERTGEEKKEQNREKEKKKQRRSAPFSGKPEKVTEKETSNSGGTTFPPYH
jgi:hypothetical protein